MNRRTAGRLAWGIAILSYAIVAACLVLLWLDRATIGSVGAGPVGNLVPAATLGALGALIAFSPHVLYPIYQQTTAQWGMDAIEDQQLAGIIMWIPAGVLMTILGVALFAAWLGEAERRVALTRSEMLTKEKL